MAARLRSAPRRHKGQVVIDVTQEVVVLENPKPFNERHLRRVLRSSMVRSGVAAAENPKASGAGIAMRQREQNRTLPRRVLCCCL
jgi:hypothetical protein